ncbi:MAG: inositol monophosphatase, partial [Gammaproteobacteria bacterium]|nr:inositol monophosphatase [Gammaproteobacteria bacterium]
SLLIYQLGSHWKDIDVLGEEMTKEEQQAKLESGRPLWCLDPLDGTTNFVSGFPVFSISLSLIIDNEIRMGLVYDPMRDELFAAEKGRGAKLNSNKLGLKKIPRSLKRSIAIVDFKRLSPALATGLATQPPFASMRSIGSVALDWCWLAASRCHVYLHGRQNLWDYSAGNLIFSEAGGHSSTLEDEPVFSNKLEPRSAVGAVEAELFSEWKNQIKALSR